MRWRICPYRFGKKGEKYAWNYSDCDPDIGAAGGASPMAAQPKLGLLSDWWIGTNLVDSRYSPATWPDMIHAVAI